MRWTQLFLFQQRSALTLLKGERACPPRTEVKPSNALRLAGESTSEDELRLLWRQIRTSFFPDREDLDAYIIRWSARRHRRTLASCNLRLTRITVARELQPHQYYEMLSPLLYHEMCHAFLGEGVARGKRGREWHGAAFRELEKRHPGIIQLNEWIKKGGWVSAVRSDRSREQWKKRRIPGTRRAGG